MIRLFVGLELPEEARERLAELESGIPNARWVEDTNLHLTLRFIGEVEEPLAEEIHDSLSEITAPAFDLEIRGVGSFDSGRRARSLWAGVVRSPELVHLRDKVESAVVRAGLPPESRKFAPHVTLARLKDAPMQRLQAFLAANNLLRLPPSRVEHFTLFRSHLGRSGAVYTAAATYPLG